MTDEEIAQVVRDEFSRPMVAEQDAFDYFAKQIERKPASKVVPVVVLALVVITQVLFTTALVVMFVVSVTLGGLLMLAGVGSFTAMLSLAAASSTRSW